MMNVRSLAIARAVAVIGGTGALIVGVTFAAQGDSVGTATLAGNSFGATYGLELSTNGTDFGPQVGGISFGTLAPGGAPSAQVPFYLEDQTGGANPLNVTVLGNNYGAFTGINEADVTVHIEGYSGGQLNGDVNSATLSQLVSPGMVLDLSNQPKVEAGGTAVPTQYVAWLTLAPGAITGPMDATTNKFDLDFAGTSND
jgi:hypothetical protein